MRNCILVIGASLFMLLGAVPKANADDHYYMIVFASQGEPNLPRMAHTFAVFVKSKDDGKGPKKDKLDISTISWLPETLNIMPLRLRPEKGKNFSLAETLKWTQSNNAQITAWGPFEIKKDLYDLAQNRIKLLNSGKIEYVVLDGRFRAAGATNCIHALSDVDETQGLLDTGTAFGEAASEIVLRHLDKWIMPKDQDLSWLMKHLELARYGLPQKFCYTKQLTSAASVSGGFGPWMVSGILPWMYAFVQFKRCETV